MGHSNYRILNIRKEGDFGTPNISVKRRCRGMLRTAVNSEVAADCATTQLLDTTHYIFIALCTRVLIAYVLYPTLHFSLFVNVRPNT